MFTLDDYRKEQWRKLKNKPYKISSLGRYKNLKTNQIGIGVLLNKKRYIRTVNELDKPKGILRIDKLVYDYFGLKTTNPYVIHLNGYLEDSSIANLKAVDKETYLEYARRHSLVRKLANNNHILMSKDNTIIESFDNYVAAVDYIIENGMVKDKTELQLNNKLKYGLNLSKNELIIGGYRWSLEKEE